MKTKQKKQVGLVRAAIISWLGGSFGRPADGSWSPWGSSVKSAGQSVTENSVLGLSAAWACTKLLAESMSTLPLHLYERTDNGRRLAVEHPMYRMLHASPNAYSSASTFWESNIATTVLRGNSYSEMQRIGNRVVAMDFLKPWLMTSRRKPDGTQGLYYPGPSGAPRLLDERNLLHIPGFSLDGRNGVSPITYGASVFGSAQAASQSAASTFERGLMPTVAFTIAQVLQQKDRDDFRENFKKISGAVMAGDPVLLEGGMTADGIGINPADAQLLESRQYSVEDVCRWFRVDPSMVGHGNKDSNWGTGLEQKLIAFLTFTLRPWLTRFEQAINRQLLSPADQLRYYAEFSIEGLLRADSKARAAFYSVMVNNGIFTRDECRRLENLPLMGGNAAVLTVQSAMTPLDALGAQTDGDTARAALAAWLDGGQQEPQDQIALQEAI